MCPSARRALLTMLEAIVGVGFAALMACSSGGTGSDAQRRDAAVRDAPLAEDAPADRTTTVDAGQHSNSDARPDAPLANRCGDPPPGPASTQAEWLMNRLLKASQGQPGPTVRDGVFDALYLLGVKPGATTADVAKAKGEIATAAQNQCLDAATCGSSYGLFRFHTTDTVYDYNSTTFILQALAPVLAKLSGQFSASELVSLTPMLVAALSAIDSGGPGPAYTNIYLMRAMDLVVVGEYLAATDEAQKHFADDGYSLLGKWVTGTQESGIVEFDSPTYYGTDLDSLGLGLQLAQNPAPFAEALGYFWSDIAANFFPAAGTLSGAHSRDYSFLYGAGGIETYLYLVGWRDVPVDDSGFQPSIEDVFAGWNILQGGYEPSAAACNLAFESPKSVTSRWGSGSGQDRTHYVSTNFALGGVSADYPSSEQEKVVSAELPAPTTVVSLVTEDDETGDDPYGDTTTQQGLFDKPFCLPSFPVVVQDRGWLLVTSYAAPLSAHPSPTLLSTNILVPVTAAITKNGQAVTPRGEVTLALNDVVTAQVDAGAVSIRVFDATDCAGKTAAPLLRFEKSVASGPVDRARIVVYHQLATGAGEAGAADAGTYACAARVAFLLAAEDCPAGGCQTPTALAAAVITNSPGTDWAVSATTPEGMLALLRADDFAAKTHTVTTRTASGMPFTTSPLAVNGNSVSLP